MTAIDLTNQMRLRNANRLARVQAMLAMLEAGRYAEVEQMLYTTAAETEADILTLRELHDALKQLELFP
jgi:hypothetical protein